MAITQQFSRLSGLRRDHASPLGEYIEVLGVIGVVTFISWFLPVSYHALGYVYLLVVILLSLRVGRWPMLFAAIVSSVTWNFVFLPPKLSFSVLTFDDSMLLGTYFTVAIIAGQFTARIRAQERFERLRERRATALFHLTRELAGAHTLDEAVNAALRQADEVFGARTTVLLAGSKGGLTPHPAGSFRPDEGECKAAEWTVQNQRESGRFTGVMDAVEGLYIPLLRNGEVLGVFAIRLPGEVIKLTPPQRDLLQGFAVQIALSIEREQLRGASEREKLFAESDRLRRTLLDSLSHELKTPLVVLRSAGDKIDTDDRKKRTDLVEEIRTATRRLDHLVANLLNQTRLESGALQPRLDWCELRDIVITARRSIERPLSGRQITIDIPHDLPLCMADAPLLEQVVANLLLNAVIHTPEGTPIEVKAGVDRANGVERIFLAVSDRGPGIPTELRESLFQKFSRGRSARPGGLGLGLSIVRGFMVAQHGEVTAGDNPGGGACFTIYLPHVAHSTVPNDEG